MDGINYLYAKYNPNDSSNLISIIKDYNSKNRFFESFQYLNSLSLYHQNISEIYNETLHQYLDNKIYNIADVDTPMIITWTIQPKNVPFLYMSDPKERLLQNMLGLAAWILDKTFKHIIIVESSNFKLDSDKLNKIGKEYGKEIQYLPFQGSDNVSKFGKGYGEGENLKYVFENCQIVKDCERFVKMNGKQYIPFYEFFLVNNKGSFEYFNLHYIANKLAIDTRFYCINRSFYEKELFDAYKSVNDHEDNYLEHVFYEKTKNRTNFYLSREPVVLGRQGSVDRNYGDYPQIVHDFCKELLEIIT